MSVTFTPSCSPDCVDGNNGQQTLYPEHAAGVSDPPQVGHLCVCISVCETERMQLCLCGQELRGADFVHALLQESIIRSGRSSLSLCSVACMGAPVCLFTSVQKCILMVRRRTLRSGANKRKSEASSLVISESTLAYWHPRDARRDWLTITDSVWVFRVDRIMPGTGKRKEESSPQTVCVCFVLTTACLAPSRGYKEINWP